ncbi:MAG: M15 family metallopeptidase, partial [Nannocystaceae bacterium]|nr:M15 family metallopeptidase [Nannocystaceae bacterium]
ARVRTEVLMGGLREHGHTSVRLLGTGPALVTAFPDVPPPKVDPTGSEPYRADELSAAALSPEAFALKQRTYAAHVLFASSQRPFVASLPKASTALVADTRFRMRVDAATAATNLLAEAKSARDAAALLDEDAADTTFIGITSAYRSADAQFARWDELFGKYFEAYRTQVLQSPAASPLAVDQKQLARFIGRRLAAPGYSLHQTGVAIDFKTIQSGQRYSAGNGTGWRTTWMYGWLQRNAVGIGFRQLKGEPWHWDFQS